MARNQGNLQAAEDGHGGLAGGVRRTIQAEPCAVQKLRKDREAIEAGAQLEPRQKTRRRAFGGDLAGDREVIMHHPQKVSRDGAASFVSDGHGLPLGIGSREGSIGQGHGCEQNRVLADERGRREGPLEEQKDRQWERWGAKGAEQDGELRAALSPASRGRADRGCQHAAGHRAIVANEQGAGQPRMDAPGAHVGADDCPVAVCPERRTRQDKEQISP